MRNLSKFLALASGLACAASLAFAADQTILGKSLTVKDPKPGVDAAKRKITGVGKEKLSPNTIVGNPTLTGSAGGAILEVFAFGPSSSNQAFTLNQGVSMTTGKPFWSAAGTTGYKYKDPKGDQGPVKSVSIKRSAGGAFSIKVKIAGKNGPVNVVPPNPGTSGCVALNLGIGNSQPGDRYSMQYGPESQIKNVSNTLFKAKKPGMEGVCPAASPTTTTTTTAPTTSSTASTTTTTASTTTTTTLYGSPSRAFLALPVDLLD